MKEHMLLEHEDQWPKPREQTFCHTPSLVTNTTKSANRAVLVRTLGLGSYGDT